jgi:hypothetical protein
VGEFRSQPGFCVTDLFQSEMNENMPLKYKQMHLDHDLSASVCHLTYPTLSAFVQIEKYERHQ